MGGADGTGSILSTEEHPKEGAAATLQVWRLRQDVGRGGARGCG